jgi:hypothetical protein
MLEKNYAMKILSFLKAKNKHVFLVWQDGKSLNGGLATIVDVSGDIVELSFYKKDTIFSISSGKNVLLRTSMLLRPMLFSLESKRKDTVLLKYSGIVPVDREKRRFLRIYLGEPMDATLLIGNMFFPTWIIDISEGGAGIVINTGKALDEFPDIYADIQFNIFNTIIKIKVRFAWISKVNFEQFFAGIELLVDSFQKNKIQKLIIDNMYNIEEQTLEFLKFL